MRPYLAFSCAALLLALAVVPVRAQGKPEAQDAPTNITADRLTYSQDRDVVIFEGKVHVIRGAMQIWSDKLTAYLEPQADAAGAEQGATPEPGLASDDAKIRSVVAVGNVRMRNEGREGFCGKATYHVAEGVLVMEENPVIIDGRNKVVGEVIRFYSQTNRSEVLGGKKRVEAVFFTKGQTLGSPTSPAAGNAARPAPPPAEGGEGFARPAPKK